MRRRGTPAGRRVPVWFLLVLCLPLQAAALDGRLDVTGTNSEGLTDNASFSTSILRLDSSLEQQIRLGRGLFFRAQYRDLNESSTSRSATFLSDYSTRTRLPAVSLNFRGARLRWGLSVEAYRRDFDGGGFGERQDERLDGSAFVQFNLSRGFATLRVSDTASDRRDTAGNPIENRDRSLRGSFQFDTAVGEFLYTGSLTHDDAITAGHLRERTTHGLRYQANRSWAGGRGRTSIEARTDRFAETLTSRFSVIATRLTPLFSGYALDDTPEELDPLEPDPVALSALSDFDRDTPTSLDIGDAAAPVREYGGDYRNLLIDFGDPESVGSAVLYVDRIVRFPEFMQWRVFVSDDPSGIDWTEIAPGRVTANWREWNDGRRGWEFLLDEPVTSRRFKFVNVKTGPTEDVILLTELELYDPLPSDRRMEESTTRRHRLVGSTSYDLTRRLTLGYRANLTKRSYDDASRDLTGTIHAFEARLRLTGLTLAGLYSLNTLESEARQNTDTRSLSLSATSDVERDLWGRLSWHHDDDRSLGRSRLTDDVALDGTWHLAPGLTVLQKTGWGTLDDGISDQETRSWFNVTTLRSQPRRSVTLDLNRSTRWVSRDAGEGYSSFNTTDSTLRWSILPLLSYSGQLRYESRDDANWLWRHGLSWHPLPGAAVDMRFSLNYHSDSRTDMRQRGGGVHATWRARPRLRLEGRADLQYQERNGVDSTPFNTQWRATWTF